MGCCGGQDVVLELETLHQLIRLSNVRSILGRRIESLLVKDWSERVGMSARRMTHVKRIRDLLLEICLGSLLDEGDSCERRGHWSTEGL